MGYEVFICCEQFIECLVQHVAGVIRVREDVISITQIAGHSELNLGIMERYRSEARLNTPHSTLPETT